MAERNSQEQDGPADRRDPPAPAVPDAQNVGRPRRPLSPEAQDRQRRGVEIGTERERAVRHMGSQGPFVIEMIADLYDSHEKARAAVRSMVRRGVVQEAGEVQL